MNNAVNLVFNIAALISAVFLTILTIVIVRKK